MTPTDNKSLDIEAIEARAAAAIDKSDAGNPYESIGTYQLYTVVTDDIPALIAEVRRLRAILREHDICTHGAQDGCCVECSAAGRFCEA